MRFGVRGGEEEEEERKKMGGTWSCGAQAGGSHVGVRIEKYHFYFLVSRAVFTILLHISNPKSNSPFFVRLIYYI